MKLTEEQINALIKLASQAIDWAGTCALIGVSAWVYKSIFLPPKS